MRVSLTLLIWLTVAPMPAAHAASDNVNAPHLSLGDTWTYVEETVTREQTRIDHSTIKIVALEKGDLTAEIRSDRKAAVIQRLMGADWSLSRSVNGRQVVTNRPLSFPMHSRKSWQVAFTDYSPSDRRHTREAWDMTMTVGQWESIEVPAGKFQALKIEGTGTWTADTPFSVMAVHGRAPDGSQVAVAQRIYGKTVAGRCTKTFWYVPEIGRWAKSEEDTFNSDGVRVRRFSASLEAISHVPIGHEGGRNAAPTAPPSPSAPRPNAKPPLRETRHDQGIWRSWAMN